MHKLFIYFFFLPHDTTSNTYSLGEKTESHKLNTWLPLYPSCILHTNALKIKYPSEPALYEPRYHSTWKEKNQKSRVHHHKTKNVPKNHQGAVWWWSWWLFLVHPHPRDVGAYRRPEDVALCVRGWECKSEHAATGIRNCIRKNISQTFSRVCRFNGDICTAIFFPRLTLGILLVPIKTPQTAEGYSSVHALHHKSRGVTYFQVWHISRPPRTHPVLITDTIYSVVLLILI